MDTETIYALSSGGGRAGVAVVRLSGAQAGAVLADLTGKPLPTPRKAVLRRLHDPASGLLLDHALVLYFPAPNSFTGEDVVEVHLHGGRAVVDGVLETLSSQPGCRLAEAGEFSRRAFEAGKLDLTEIEGLADLINADTEMQRVQALRQLDGSLRRLYEDWRSRLMRHLAHLEADIDFPDEDLPDGVAGTVRPDIAGLKRDVDTHLRDGRRGETMRDGYRIVILGAPNAGKSTLLNALARSDVAIVSDEAGTTRDVLDVPLDLSGYPVRLVDTAGLRMAGGKVEAEGIRRAVARAEEADLRLLLVRADAWPHVPDDVARWSGPNSLLVVSQVDRIPVFHVEHESLPANIKPETAGPLPVSAIGESGLDALLETVGNTVSTAMALRDAPALTRARHREVLIDVTEHLARFDINAGIDPVLAAEDVRQAARALGRITGRVGVEDMLDLVFADFCIGK